MDDHAGARYLRLLVEHILLSGDRHGEGPSTIENAGAALVAVGLVDRRAVSEIRNDLALAEALRRSSPDAAQLTVIGDPSEEVTMRPAAVAAPRAVATGRNQFETPEGVLVVESISFGPDGATIVETLEAGRDGGHGALPRTAAWPLPEPMRPVLARRSPWTPRRRSEAPVGDHRPLGPAPRTGAPGAPPRSRPVGAGREQLRITDDRGTTYRRGPGESFGGSGTWRWVSSLEPIPDHDTTWIEIALGSAAPTRLP